MKSLSHKYVCNSFAAAMQFVQEIGRIAEALQHHPEILIRYREVTVTATTHEAGNQVTQKDEQLMAAIKQASAKYRKA